MLAGRIERALQKGLPLDELSADKRSLPPDMRWAAISGSGCPTNMSLLPPDMRQACYGRGCWVLFKPCSGLLHTNLSLQQPLVRYQNAPMQI